MYRTVKMNKLTFQMPNVYPDIIPHQSFLFLLERYPSLQVEILRINPSSNCPFINDAATPTPRIFNPFFRDKMAEEKGIKYRQALLAGGKIPHFLSGASKICIQIWRWWPYLGGLHLWTFFNDCWEKLSKLAYALQQRSGSPFWKNKFDSNSGLVAPFGARGAKRTTLVAFDAIAGFGCGDRRQFVVSGWRAAWVRNRGRSDESTQRSRDSSKLTREIKGENWNCFYLVSMACVLFERIHILSNLHEIPRSMLLWSHGKCSLDKTQIKI